MGEDAHRQVSSTAIEFFVAAPPAAAI